MGADKRVIQCDQIWLFLKSLDERFSDYIRLHFGLFEKCPISDKTTVANFGQLLKNWATIITLGNFSKIEQLFIPSSGHTGGV